MVWMNHIARVVWCFVITIVCALTATAQFNVVTGGSQLQMHQPTTGGLNILLNVPNNLLSSFTLEFATGVPGRNSVLYANGYVSPTLLTWTNSSTTLNNVFRMSDANPPVPGWFPRNPNIWVTSGGNPVSGAPYTSSGELGASPTAGSQWFGTLDASPIQFVAGLATATPANNLVRAVMSADGVLSLGSALQVRLFPLTPTTNLLTITKDSVPTSMMVRSQGIARIANVRTNSGSYAVPIWGTLAADSNTIVGAGSFRATGDSSLGNTTFGTENHAFGLIAGRYGAHPTVNTLYFSGIRNTAFGYRASWRNLYGGHTVAVGSTAFDNTTFSVGDVAIGMNALGLLPLNPGGGQNSTGPGNATRIYPSTAVGLGALLNYNNSNFSPGMLAIGTEALALNQVSRNLIGLGHKSARGLNSSVNNAFYLSRDSESNSLLIGSLWRGRLMVNPPNAAFNLTSARDPSTIDAMLMVYAAADSDQNGTPDPTPLDQYTVPTTTILSPSTMDPTLRLTVPEAMPVNLNDDAVRGTRTGGANNTLITDNTKAWVAGEWVGHRVLITGGGGAGLIREITANTANTLTVAATAGLVNGSKYMILPSFFDVERNAAGNVQLGTTNFQLDLQGNVHMRPYGTSTGEDQSFGQVAEMRLYDITNFEAGTRSSGNTTTLRDNSKSWVTDIYANAVVRIVGGAGVGQVRRITGNNNNTITVSPAFTATLGPSTQYEIEIVSETGTATSASASSITDEDKNWDADFLNFTGSQIRIIGGQGQGQTRTITSSSLNTVTVYPPFSVLPNATSVYEISRWFPRYVGFRAANNVPYPAANVFMNLPNPNTIPANGRNALTILDDDPLTLGWVAVGSMAFPHTWNNKSADIGEAIDASPLYGWPTAGYAFGSIGAAEETIIMGTKLNLVGPPTGTLANLAPRATYNTGFGWNVMTSLDNVTNAGDSNVAVGHIALELLTTGRDNIALGKNALRNLTTGIQNVAIGFNALTSLVTGSRNTAIGTNALRSSVATTGANTAIGDSAMASLTTGISNTAIGWLAMRSATTANENVAIGDSAAYALTTGSDNVTIGQRSAPALTTGSNNVVVGRQALAAGATINNSIAIGEQAMFSLTTGTDNVAIGRFPMQNAVQASFNVAIGDSSLRNVNTGDSNIAVGAGALIALTTGDNNVALGDSALSALTTGSNNIAAGPQTLRSIVSANRNIGMGSSTLIALTTGDNNIALGREALMSLTNGSNNIAAGFRTLRNVTAGSDHIAIGDSALLNLIDGSASSIAIGQGALYSLTASTATNIALGYRALYSTTSSFDNIAIGNSAMQGLVSGDGKNIAIGQFALNAGQTYTENVAIGDSALYSATSSWNVAVGQGALRSLDADTAHGNVAVGRSAMWSARGARHNVAVGDSALVNLQHGTGNVAVGFVALGAVTTSFNNVAIGQLSLTGASSGDDNVAVGNSTAAFQGVSGTLSRNTIIGFQALKDLNAGSSNTVVGAGAMQSTATAGAPDSGNVAIGVNAGLHAPAGTNNALFIGVFSTESLLFGQFGAGRLMINATQAIGGSLPVLNAALQVNPTNASTRGVVVRMAAAPTISPFIIQDDLEATRFEIQTSGAFPSVNGVAYTWPGAAPAAEAAGTQTGRATIAASSAGVLTFQQLTTTVTTDPLDLPAVLANASADIVVPNAVTGAAPGDVVSLGVPNAAANQNLVSYQAWVSANDQVTIRVSNFSANALVALDDQVFKIVVVK